MRKFFIFVSTVIVLTQLIWSAPGIAQTIPRDQAVRPHRWDGGRGTLFFGVGLLQRSSRPIRSYSSDGTQRGSDIDVFKDLPNLRKVVVEDLAAGPNGTTAIACVLNFGSTVQHVVLTYGASGELRSILDTEPYFPHAITIDDDGTIFVLGERMDKSKGDSAYPLVVKYGSDGKVAGQLLLSSSFRSGAEAIEKSERDDAEASIMFRDGKLYVYAPTENEILVCTTSGVVLHRLRLDGVLDDIARKDRVKRAGIRNVSFMDPNKIVLELIEYSGSQVKAERVFGRGPGMHPVAYLVNLQTAYYKLVARGEMSTKWVFIGTRGNELLTLNSDGQEHAITSHVVSEN